MHTLITELRFIAQQQTCVVFWLSKAFMNDELKLDAVSIKEMKI